MAVLEVNETNFDAEVVNAPVPVVVDFWAPWCGPCRMLSPVIEELSAEYGARLKVGKVNTDENLGIAGKYQITSIPTLLIFKGQKLQQRIVGFKSKIELKKVIDDVLE